MDHPGVVPRLVPGDRRLFLKAATGTCASASYQATAGPSRPAPTMFFLLGSVASCYDRRVVSGVVYVIRNGLQWKDAPKDYGSHKTLYNRCIRWSRLGVFDRILASSRGRRPKAQTHHDRTRRI